MPLGYSTVRVNVGALIIDGVDDDALFDDVPVTGNMVLTPMLDPAKPVQVDDGGVMKIKAIAPFDVEIGMTGEISHRNRNYVNVPAPTSLTSNLSILQWRASFNGLKYGVKAVTVPPIYFWAEPGLEINLADHINVGPNSTALQLSRGPRGFGIGEVEADGAELVFRSEADGNPEISRVTLPPQEAAVGADSITEAELADTAVTGPKIAQDAVTASKLANGAVARAKLADAVLVELDAKVSKTQADNSYAPIPSSVLTKAPALPSKVKAYANPAGVTVRWSPSPIGFAPVSYLVAAGAQSVSVPATQFEANLTGLPNGTAVTPTVRAVNSAGQSAAVSANAVTPTADPLGLGFTAGWASVLLAETLTGANTDPVAAWPDASGNGKGASQSVTSNQPVLLASWTNSKKAVTFDGTNDTMSIAELTQEYIGGRMTIYIVADITAFSGDRRVLCNQFLLTGNAGSSEGMFVDTNGNAWRTQVANGSVSYPSAALNTPAIISVTAPGSVYKDGAKITTTHNPGAIATTAPYWIGSLGGVAAKAFPGRIGLIAIARRVHTDAERQAVEAALAARFGITVGVS